MITLGLHRIEELFTKNNSNGKTEDETLAEVTIFCHDVPSKQEKYKQREEERMVEEARKVEKSGWKGI